MNCEARLTYVSPISVVASWVARQVTIQVDIMHHNDAMWIASFALYVNLSRGT